MDNLIMISNKEVQKAHEFLNNKRKPNCCEKPSVDIEKHVMVLIPSSDGPSDLVNQVLVSTCKNCGEIKFYAPHILGIDLD